MSPFAFISQRSQGYNALAHVSDGMNPPLSMTIHTVGKAGYGWSVVSVVEVGHFIPLNLEHSTTGAKPL